jgi:hypothetical protein
LNAPTWRKKSKRRTHQLVRPKNQAQLWLAPCYLNNCSHQDIKGPPPQQYSRLVRLADPWCRKRPCCSRTYRCWSRRSRGCWPCGCRSCRLSCRLLFSSGLLLGSWLFGSGFLCCRLLRRYFLLGSWLFGSGFLCCRLLRRYFLLGSWLFGSGFLCCRLLRRYLFSSRFLGCCFFCCWFLLCYHFLSPSVMKVKKYCTCCYCTSSPCSAASTGQSQHLKSLTCG